MSILLKSRSIAYNFSAQYQNIYYVACYGDRHCHRITECCMQHYVLDPKKKYYTFWW